MTSTTSTDNLFLVGFNNGVYDLRKGEFTPCSHTLPTTGYNYVEVKAEDKVRQEVEQFMTQLFPDPEIYSQACEWMASLLDGKRSSYIHVLRGNGSNGKTCLVNLLMATLGQYATILGDIAGLRDKRFVYILEPEKRKIPLMKELTGSDTISCRPLYGNRIEFTPECKMCTDYNYNTLQEPEEGMKRRTKVIECESQFMKNPDPTNPYQFAIDTEISCNFPEWRKGLMSLLLSTYKKNRIYEEIATPIATYLSTRVMLHKNLAVDLSKLLYESLIDNDYDKAEYLIKIGADVNKEPPHYSHPIYQAVARGNAKLVKLLLDNGVDPNGKQNPLTFGPLYALPYAQLHQVIYVLLEYGADPNFTNLHGNSPMDMVISELYPYKVSPHSIDECIDIMNLLVSYGASVYKDGHYIPNSCREYFIALEKHLSPYETADPDENELPAPAKKIQKVR
jgi:hypothetical protein